MINLLFYKIKKALQFYAEEEKISPNNRFYTNNARGLATDALLAFEELENVLKNRK